jgi:hypothetical protein
VKDGGDERARTADPLLAKQVLCQLSYIPKGMAADGAGLAGARPEGSPHEPGGACGGPLWTRTTDLTVISRAL